MPYLHIYFSIDFCNGCELRLGRPIVRHRFALVIFQSADSRERECEMSAAGNGA